MDLNLLVALDALLDGNSVQGAAERLHLSAPAMSRTLARIRQSTGDQILVRAGRTMVPTPRALEIRDETRDLVRRAREVLRPHAAFDPATLERDLAIRGHDVLLGALAVPLAERVASAAPAVRLRFLPESTDASADLAQGAVDLELGATAPSRPDLLHQRLGADELVAVLRPTSPLARGELTLGRFAAAPHVSVSRRGRLEGDLDAELSDRRRSRRVLASLPTAAAALEFAARTDALVVVTGHLTAPLVRAFGLTARRLPFRTDPVPVVAVWHRRSATDPAHAWLRGLVADCFAELLSAPTH